MAVENEMIEENFIGLKNAVIRRIKEEWNYEIKDFTNMKVT